MSELSPHMERLLRRAFRAGMGYGRFEVLNDTGMWDSEVAIPKDEDAFIERLYEAAGD